MPTTTKYIWDDANYLAEADGSDTINVVYTNEPQQYGNLVSTRISNTTSYHHFDGLGSTRQLTNSVKTVTDTAIYDAWGNVVSRSGTTAGRLLWIAELGYYFDPETALPSVRERSYDSTTGRWTAVDPFEPVDSGRQRQLAGQRSDLYTYAENSPISYVDPSGLRSVRCYRLELLIPIYWCASDCKGVPNGLYFLCGQRCFIFCEGSCDDFRKALNPPGMLA